MCEGSFQYRVVLLLKECTEYGMETMKKTRPDGRWISMRDGARVRSDLRGCSGFN